MINTVRKRQRGQHIKLAMAADTNKKDCTAQDGVYTARFWDSYLMKPCYMASFINVLHVQRSDTR
jgi:hypothetical protein